MCPPTPLVLSLMSFLLWSVLFDCVLPPSGTMLASGSNDQVSIVLRWMLTYLPVLAPLAILSSTQAPSAKFLLFMDLLAHLCTTVAAWKIQKNHFGPNSF